MWNIFQITDFDYLKSSPTPTLTAFTYLKSNIRRGGQSMTNRPIN